MRPQVKKIIILSIVFSLAGIGMLGASFYFLYMEGVEKSKEKLAQLDLVLEDYRQKKAEIPRLKEGLRQIRLRAQKAQQQIPLFDENEFDRFLFHLRNVARSTGVEMKTPRVIPGSRPQPEVAPQIVRATYDLNVTSDFKRLWDFLKVMESSIRFVELETFSFGKATGGEVGQTSLQMKVSVFAFKSDIPKQPEDPPKEKPRETTIPPQ
jgi:Tfp pilus assembly protein PilO